MQQDLKNAPPAGQNDDAEPKSVNHAHSQEQEKAGDSSKRSVISALSGIFGSKARKEQAEEIFTPSIIISGVGTPVKVEIPVTKPEFIIGSNPEAVDGAVRFNRAISRIHCKISFINNKYYISDMGSSNGTYVNSALLSQGKRVQITVGTRINLADSEFEIKEIVPQDKEKGHE